MLPFINHAKHMVRAYFILPVTQLGHEPTLMELYMETNIEGGYTKSGVEVYGQSSQGVHCKKNLKPFVYFVDNFFGDILNFFFYV